MLTLRAVFYALLKDDREMGCKISKKQRDVAIEKMLTYRKWLIEHVLRVETDVTLVILPVADAVPTYRDIDPG